MMLPKRSQAGIAVPDSTGVSRPEPGFPSAEPGTSVDVTWGEELFQPVEYNGLRVGPFRATTVVRSGETVAAATYRLWLELNAAAMAIRDEKAKEYLRALENMTTAARTPR